MYNPFKKKTKTINNINDLLALSSYKGDENIKVNGDLLYVLYEHSFDVYNRSDEELLSTCVYTYLHLKSMYSSFKGANFTIKTPVDAYSVKLISDCKQWVVEYDHISGVVIVYPNINGWVDDKSKLEMTVEDLNPQDRVYLESLFE